ncbi:hypothetical protein E6C70_09225 [Glaciibacter flavus]|uniref:Uncharacterized protein n=1 Tax=Orlajensenia flava TaxID=2565934 RepID=A0A4S4FXL8_9MICO|nr:hypothetical protein [Glaciibacter flavus]THG34436.1 hypothetical protein E6C70_09225 [Glaciibacter flavus]
MTIALSQLADCTPPGGWPQWVITAPYDDRCHPQATPLPALEEGANCQRFAYAVLGLFGLAVPPDRIESTTQRRTQRLTPSLT